MVRSRSTVISLALLCLVRDAFGFFAMPPAAAVCRSLGTRSSFVRISLPTCQHEPKFRRQVQGVQALTATLPSDLPGKERLEKFIDDCGLLGPVRFVCMTDGAILEAVGSFDNLRYSDLPKGRFATVSEGAGFECHLNTDKIKTINMVTKQSPSGHDLYITRFLDTEGETVLSAMLHGKDGSYEPGATDYWEKLRKTFGAEQTVA